MPLKPNDCSKFYSCNAPICPLDPLWPKAVHLPGEPVCAYLLATGKEGAAERYGHDPVYRECLAQLPLVATGHPDIARKVAAAARYGFKGDHRRGKRVGQKAAPRGAADTVAGKIDPEAA